MDVAWGDIVQINIRFNVRELLAELPGCRKWDQEDGCFRVELPSGEYLDFGDNEWAMLVDDENNVLRQDLDELGIDYYEV